MVVSEAADSGSIPDGRTSQFASPRRLCFWHVNFAFPHDPRQWPEGMRQRYDPPRTPLPANFAESIPSITAARLLVGRQMTYSIKHLQHQVRIVPPPR